MTARMPASARAIAQAVARALRGVTPVAQVQAKGELDGPGIHAVAAQGLTGSAAALPFLDQIQRAFGHHDVSGVRAHIGGPAAAASDAMNARAYASGDAVAFASEPDLHLAAHEAAHVVQQRGGVRLSGGVGAAGDEYERHADAVADAVVRGESAEGLLDRYAHRGAAGGPAVQRDPRPGAPATAVGAPTTETDAEQDRTRAGMQGYSDEIERRRQRFEQQIVPEYSNAAARIAAAIVQSTSTVNRQLDGWCATLEREALQEFAQSYTEALGRMVVEEAVGRLLESHPLIMLVLNAAYVAYQTHEGQQEVAAAQGRAEFRNSVAANARDALAHNVVTIATSAMSAIDAPYFELRDRFSGRGGGASVVQRGLHSAGETSGEGASERQREQEQEAAVQADEIDEMFRRFTSAIQRAENSARQIVPLGQRAIQDAQVAYTRFLAGGRGQATGARDAEEGAGQGGREGEVRHDPHIRLRGHLGGDRSGAAPMISNIRLLRASSLTQGGGGDFPRGEGEHIDSTLSRTWPELVAAGFRPTMTVTAMNARGQCELTIVNVTSDNVEIQERSAEVYRVLAGFLDMPDYSDEQAALVVLRMQAGRLSSTPFSQYD